MTADLPERALAAARRRAQDDPRWQQAQELLELLPDGDSYVITAAALVAGWECYSAERRALDYVAGRREPDLRHAVADYLEALDRADSEVMADG